MVQRPEGGEGEGLLQHNPLSTLTINYPAITAVCQDRGGGVKAAKDRNTLVCFCALAHPCPSEEGTRVARGPMQLHNARCLLSFYSSRQKKKTDRGFAVKNHSLEDVFLAFCMKQSRRLGGSGPTERPEE